MKSKNLSSNIEIIDEFLKYDGDIYQVFPNGEILTRISLQGHLTSNFRKANTPWNLGYETVRFKNHRLLVHRVIFRKFGGELIAGLHINHINGITNDNRISNLEQITPRENQLHKYRVLGNKGVIGNPKISYEIAKEIRQDRNNGMKYSAIMAKYGLAKSTVGYIINNKTWTSEG